MCVPSSECTKFGGNAVLCFLTSTWNWHNNEVLEWLNIISRKEMLKTSPWHKPTMLPSRCKAKIWSDVLICSPIVRKVSTIFRSFMEQIRWYESNSACIITQCFIFYSQAVPSPENGLLASIKISHFSRMILSSKNLNQIWFLHPTKWASIKSGQCVRAHVCFLFLYQQCSPNL